MLFFGGGMKIFGLASSMLALCSSQAAVAAPSWVEKIRFTINISGKHFVNTSDGFSNMQKGRFFEGNVIAEFHEYPYTKDPKGHRLLLWNTKSCDGYYSIGDTGEVKGIDPIEGGGGTATSLYSLRASGETKNCSISIAMDSETRKVNVHISTGIRVRTHLSHQMTVAAMAMVAMKVLMLRSKRVATLRQSLKRQNIRSTTLRCL